MKDKYSFTPDRLLAARGAMAAKLSKKYPQVDYATDLGVRSGQISRWGREIARGGNPPGKASQRKIIEHAEKNGILHIFEVENAKD